MVVIRDKKDKTRKSKKTRADLHLADNKNNKAAVDKKSGSDDGSSAVKKQKKSREMQALSRLLRGM